MISNARSESGCSITRRFLTRRAEMSTVPFWVFSSSRWIGSISPERSMVVKANLIANLPAVRRHVLAAETVPKRPDLVLGQHAVARMLLVKLRQVDAGL